MGEEDIKLFRAHLHLRGDSSLKLPQVPHGERLPLSLSWRWMDVVLDCHLHVYLSFDGSHSFAAYAPLHGHDAQHVILRLCDSISRYLWLDL